MLALLSKMSDADVRDYIVSVCMSDLDMTTADLNESVGPILLSSDFVKSEAECMKVCGSINKSKCFHECTCIWILLSPY